MEFVNPSPEYRIVPFWFWNGDMGEEHIRHQIHEMADQGVGGFFICPRQGLQIPYLSRAWFERVRFATEVARERGLHVWLYDEYPYPSGIAGGEVVLRHPEAKHRLLVRRAVDVTGPQDLTLELPWGRTLSAVATPHDHATGECSWRRSIDLKGFIGNHQAESVFQKVGLTAYNRSRFFTYRPEKQLRWDVPQGTWNVSVFIEVEIGDFKYYGTYVDPCNAEAVETFIRTTHDRYAQTIGDYFGNTVKGMFTDEVGLLGDPPWSPRIEDLFLRMHGYSLVDHLPDLYRSVGEQTPRVRYAYFQALHLLLRETYHRKISGWCDRHGLQYVAEVPSLRMTNQVYSHVPAGDSAHEKLGRSLEWVLQRYTGGFRDDPKMVSSLARQLGRDRALIECFHSVGWSMTLQDAKWMIDRLVALGINAFNFHAFFFTLDGLTKHDAPPSQFLQNPYWPHFRYLSDYAARASYVMSQGAAATHIAVLDPTTTLWTHMGNPLHGFRYCGAEPEERERLDTLRQDWSHICNSLLLNQIDYDHLDPEILAEARVDGGKIVIGHATYSTLVIPPISNLEAAAWERVKAFVSTGGIVIGMGLLPYEVIEEGAGIEDESLEWFGMPASPRSAYFSAPDTAEERVPNRWFGGERGTYFLACQGSLIAAGACDDLLGLLMRVSPPSVRLEMARGERDSLLMHHRVLPDSSELVFVTHQEDQAKDIRILVDWTHDDHTFESLDLETGASETVHAERTPDSYQVPLHFEPYQSLLIRFARRPLMDKHTAAERGKTPDSSENWQIVVDASQAWEIVPEKSNVLRFGTFQFQLDSAQNGIRERWHAAENEVDWPEVQTKTVIDQCADIARSQNMPVRFTQSFGSPMDIGLAYPLSCWYRASFTVEDLPEDCHLLMDGSAISGEYVIYLNGHALTGGDFQPEFRYDHNNRARPVNPWLREGQNSLVVNVQANRDWDGLVDPLYLTGSFGVRFDAEGRPILARAPRFTSLHGGVHGGYPYFSGTLRLKREIAVTDIPAREFELGFENWDPHFHECAEVLVNGRSIGVRPWTPYRWKGSSETLRIGENTLEVRVTNTLSSMLEGKYFDYASHDLKDVRTFGTR